jgi:hypothetical protein
MANPAQKGRVMTAVASAALPHPDSITRVRVYIDGFNLYYGCRDLVDAQATRTSWKWLDVEALALIKIKSVWPNASIVGTHYFTARVSKRHGGDGAPDRQDAYLRGLQRRGVEVVPGRFLQKTKWRPLVSNPKRMVEVHDTEEKGSDVNLATRLLADHFLRPDTFDGAVVISNDSDLEMPIRLLRDQGAPLGVINPHRKPTPLLWPKGLLLPHFGRRIELADLAAAQLPDPITDKSGVVVVTRSGRAITKPANW